MKQIVVKGNTIALSGEVSRESVNTLRAKLLSVMAASTKPYVVRLAGVSAIDSAGVQLLSSLLKGFPQLRVAEVSDATRLVLARLGVPGLFGGA